MDKSKKEKSDSRVLFVRRGIGYVVLILLSILSLFSFYILLVNATRAHVDIQKGFSILPGSSFFKNFSNLMDNQNLPVLTGIRNSVFVSICTAFITTYVSALTAYAIHAYDFKLKKAAFTFILLIMMVPSQISALGFIRLMGDFHLMNTFIPLIIPAAASPVVFFFMKQYMESSLPIEIVEASRMDGSGEFFTFNRIIIPIMKPAIAVQAIFSFVSSWNNYFTPALILEKKDLKTLPILIAQLRSADFLKFDTGQIYMLITIAILPVIIAYLFLSKFIVQGVAVGSVKG